MLDIVPRLLPPGPARKVLLTTSATGAAVLVTFMVGVVFARTLGPSGKGQVDLALATIYLASLVFGFSVGPGLTFLVARGSDTQWASIVAALVAVSVTLATLLLLTFVQNSPLEGAVLPAGQESPLSLMAVGAGAFAFWALVQAILVGLARPVFASTVALAGRAVTLGLVAWLLLVTPSTRDALVLALGAIVGGWLVSGFMGMVAVTVARQGKGGDYRVLIGYSLRHYGHALVQFGNQRLDIFLVALFTGSAGVGLYVVAASIAQLLWIPANSAAQVVVPSVASVSNAMPVRAVRAALAGTLSVSILIAAAAPIAVPLIFGEAFRESVLPLLILVPGAVAYAVGRVAGAYLTGIGMPELNAKAGAVGLWSHWHSTYSLSLHSESWGRRSLARHRISPLRP